VTFQSSRGRIVPPNLDDRTWQDLVNEMTALIPSYAPQWTDLNPSDLGMSLIELFAWLAEGIIYRLNQTPDANYIKFLNLLGITRDPATPAHTYLTFISGSGSTLVPAGTQAQTAAQQGQAPIIFETDEDITVLPTTLKAALAIGPYFANASSSQYDNVTTTLIGPPAAKYLVQVPPAQQQPSPQPSVAQLALGFDQHVANQIVLGLNLYLPLRMADLSQVKLTWVHSAAGQEPMTWPAIPAATDGTGSLQHDGKVRLTLPADWTAQRAAAQGSTPGWTTVTPVSSAAPVTDPLLWIGLRVENSAVTPLTFGIDRLLFNSALARTALTVPSPELLGQSNGQPFQVFALKNRPLFRRPGIGPPYADLHVQMGTGSPVQWQDWALVDDLPPGPGKVYRVDPTTGEIRFGDYNEQTTLGHGSVPPSGSQIRALSYRYVATGSAGNVASAQVTVLSKPPAGGQATTITNVLNLGPGLDGADEEPIEDTLRRAPEELKIRDRAVTADDYEFLAGEASTDVAIRRCLTPRLQTADGPGTPPAWHNGDPWTFAGITRAPGNVSVIIVPDQGPAVAMPGPTQDLIAEVTAYLEARRDLTAHLQVIGPRYLPVIVSVGLVVWQEAIDAGADEAKVKADTLDLIRAFLHPTRGGPDGTGWLVGQPVFTSDLFRAIMPAEDIGYISTLQVGADIPAYHFPPLNTQGTRPNYNDATERPFPILQSGQTRLGASVRVADYELVCAAADNLQQVNSIRASI
jgi:predicted phage baseplate assembly protein